MDHHNVSGMFGTKGDGGRGEEIRGERSIECTNF
jgi:hypothetical protein